jgi:ABC-type lipoprotein export system ATPase subunit
VNSVLEARDLFRVYSTDEGTAAALQGLSLDIAAGEIVVVFGPSGSGKTTFLRVAAGLDRPSAGRVSVLGLDLRRLSGRRLDEFRAAAIGYADQHYSRVLAPELDVRSLVELPLALAGEARRERRMRVIDLLERVGLADRAGAHPGELSGGEQQRIALCAAVARRPRLLLADEPTGELDAESAAPVYALIRDVVRGEATTAVIVSHDLASTSIADRIVQLRDGRVSAETERAGSSEAESIVVARGGWVHLPEEFLRGARIRRRARASLGDRQIVLASADEPPERAERIDQEGPSPLRQRRETGAVAELRDVERIFGRGSGATSAIKGLTARFGRGRLAAITGPSGSGKTTILHLLAGLDVPTAGEVVVLEETVSHLDRTARARFRRQRLALVAQDASLVPFLSARENVVLALGLRGIGQSEAEEAAEDALRAVGMSELADQRLARLSMGERQRLAIARAVAGRPQLLLADEPSARLDQASALAIGRLLAQLTDELGTSVIFSTHDPVLIDLAEEVLEL